MTVSVTVYVPAAVYVHVGFGSVESTISSPLKSHWKPVGSPVESVESNVTESPGATVVGLCRELRRPGPGGGVIG